MKWLIGIFLFFVMLSVGILIQERLPKETMENIAGSYLLTTITVVSGGIYRRAYYKEEERRKIKLRIV